MNNEEKYVSHKNGDSPSNPYPIRGTDYFFRKFTSSAVHMIYGMLAAVGFYSILTHQPPNASSDLNAVVAKLEEPSTTSNSGNSDSSGGCIPNSAQSDVSATASPSPSPLVEERGTRLMEAK